MPSFSRPTDPPEFLHAIEDFAGSPHVAEILARIEDQFVADWELAKTVEQREAAWHGKRAVNELRIKLTSIAGGKSVFDAHAKNRPRAVPVASSGYSPFSN